MKTTVYILVTTARPHWLGKQIAKSIARVGARTSQINYKVVSLEDYNLPFMRSRRNDSRNWYRKLDDAAGFIFVTPFQNDRYPESLTKALKYLKQTWKEKPVGFVSYGYLNRRSASKELAVAASDLSMLPVAASVQIDQPWELMAEDGEMTLSRSQQNRISTMMTQINSTIRGQQLEQAKQSS